MRKLISFPLIIALFSLTIGSLLNCRSVTAQESPPANSAQELEPGFSWLFDGKTLDGWEGNLSFFRIEDNAIVAGNLKTSIPNNEFLCTRKSYSNFDFRAQVKLIGEGKNAGIQFRTKRIPNHHEVSGFQFDVGEGGEGPIWGALYDESRRKKMLAMGDYEAVKKWVKVGEWNDIRILAEGKHIQLFLNGNRTVDYTEEDADIDPAGIIGLQIHSGPPAEAWYRSIRIREL